MTRPRRPGLDVLSHDAPSGDGSLDAWWGSARVLVKPNSDDHPWVALNELLAARLAAAVGLPVPMGEVGVIGDNQLAWVSAQVRLNSQEVAPADPGVIATHVPWLVAGCTVFDVLIHNVDRHDDNLIFHPRLGLWLIDHEQAFAGSARDLPQVLTGSRQQVTPPHAFRGHVRQNYAGEWVDRVDRMPLSVVEGIVGDARKRRLVTVRGARSLRTFLRFRQRHLRTLVARSLGWPNPDPSSIGPKGERTWQDQLPPPGTS